MSNCKNIKINKELFNFKLGTTSFIYPDNIIPNVKKLGSVFDEIELLIFEGSPESVLPSKHDILELTNLAGEFDLTYNVHLPVDVSITDSFKLKRDQAVAVLIKVIDLVSPLSPATHTLHLDHPKNIDNEDWYQKSFDALSDLVKSIGKPEIISIETLDYPFGIIEPLIDEYGLSVCIDVGHLIKYGYDIKPVFEKYSDKIPLIHLHGVDFTMTPPQDHVSLDKTPADKLADTLDILKRFQGVVSLEVFNKHTLISSLSYLERLFSI